MPARKRSVAALGSHVIPAPEPESKASIFYTGVLLFSPAISRTSFGTR